MVKKSELLTDPSVKGVRFMSQTRPLLSRDYFYLTRDEKKELKFQEKILRKKARSSTLVFTNPIQRSCEEISAKSEERRNNRSALLICE